MKGSLSVDKEDVDPELIARLRKVVDSGHYSDGMLRKFTGLSRHKIDVILETRQATASNIRSLEEGVDCLDGKGYSNDEPQTLGPILQDAGVLALTG